MGQPTIVEGPDGQKYEFPEGVSQEEMRAAMEARYPSQPQQTTSTPAPRQSTYNQRVVESLTDPENVMDNASAAISGINNLLYFGMDDEIANWVGSKTGFKPLQQYEQTQDRLREEKPFMFQGGQMSAGLAPPVLAARAAGGTNVLKTAGVTGVTGAAYGLPHGYNDADAPGQNRLKSGALVAGFGGAGGGLLGAGGAAFAKRFATISADDARAAIAEIGALDDAPIRPQSVRAFRRLLRKSGMSDDTITALHREVGNRMNAVEGGTSTAAGRKRFFQHVIEILAENEGSPYYNPQAAANVLMTVQERANSALPKDRSRSIVGAAVNRDRASQVPFLQESAEQIAQGTRVGTKNLVADTRAALGAQYDRVLDEAARDPLSHNAALEMIGSIRPLLDGPSGLKVQATAEGVPLDELIAQNPIKALHWIQAAARRKAASSDPNRAAYQALRQRILPVIEDAAPDYARLRREYATNEGLESAATFGDRLFGGAQSNLMNNPGMRQELVEEFHSLTPTEQQIALVSIRDQALGKIAGSQEEAPARIAQLNTNAALSFLEDIGAKPFADDIRAIARENQLLSVADAGNPLRQSATFSNAQARTDAPPLYESTLANMVNNSTPGTLAGEGLLMAFAPHYQGAYAAYRGSRLAAKMGLGTRTETLEDMTRLLMSRPDAPPANAFNQSPTTPPAPQNAFNPTPADEPVQNGITAIGRPEIAGAAIGAGAGGLAPADSTEERLRNMGVGAALGATAGRADRALRTTRSGVPTTRRQPMEVTRPSVDDVPDAQFYHGTTRQFDEFDAAAPRSSIDNHPGDGVFLSSDKNVAAQYAEGPGGRIVPVNPNVKNTMTADMGGESSYQRIQELIDQAKANGHDSLLIKNVRDGVYKDTPVSDVMVVFRGDDAVIVNGLGNIRRNTQQASQQGFQRGQPSTRSEAYKSTIPQHLNEVEELQRLKALTAVVGVPLAGVAALFGYSNMQELVSDENGPSLREVVRRFEEEIRSREGMPPTPSRKPELPQNAFAVVEGR